MTTAPLEPRVELRFNPTDLRPSDLPKAGAYLGSPAEALEAALAVTRATVVTQMRAEVAGIQEPTRAQLLRIADLAWQAAFWKYRKISAPILADAYLKAYRAADAGDVPMAVIYDLADKHAEKIGMYFHETSAEALAEGFDRMVNRQIPAKEAANRVMDAYGLSPRQMRGYTGSKFQTPISDVMPRSLKAKARAYIDKAFTTRNKKLSTQEEHNIEEQAKQYAWMWLQNKGRLSEKAQKMWITAHDERVCEVCGPLNGQKVLLGERFKTKEGEFWTPGLHPNCRCVVRLLENRFAKALSGSALHEFDLEHPRGEHGRFSAKARTKTIDVDDEFERIISGIPPSPPGHLTYAFPNPPAPAPRTKTEDNTRALFEEIIANQPKQRRGLYSSLESPLGQGTAAALDVSHDIEARQEQVLDFAADLVVHLRQEVKRDALTKPVRVKAPTIPLGGDYFTFITADQLENGDIGKLRVNHGMTWTRNEVSAGLAASIQVHANEASAIRNIEHKGLNKIRMKDKTGTEYVATLSDNEVRRAVGWYVQNSTAHWHEHDEPPFDDGVSVEWKLAHGRGGREDVGAPAGLPDWMSFRTLGPRMEIDSREFETYVVRADQAPFAEGAVEFGEPDEGGGVTMDGEFTLVPGSVSRLVHKGAGHAVTTYKVEPAGSVELPAEPSDDFTVEREKRRLRGE